MEGTGAMRAFLEIFLVLLALGVLLFGIQVICRRSGGRKEDD